MSSAEVTTITADELLSLPDAAQYELVHGQLVERTMSHHAVWVNTRILCYLRRFLEKNPLGDIYGNGASYQCFPHEKELVRKPNGSLIHRGRLPQDQFLKGHARVVPDLVVEVLSPNDLAYDVSERIFDYLRVSVPLIWIVNPSTRSVMVYADGGSRVQLLQEDDQITGRDVLPGFECRVSGFFPSLDRTAA